MIGIVHGCTYEISTTCLKTYSLHMNDNAKFKAQCSHDNNKWEEETEEHERFQEKKITTFIQYPYAF